ncbi:ral guanine nucleotide dissociation stimulator-like 1 isoform X1 [Amphibalanus amphitrite]|uniref:ral guanine nucleotide dissociation stimulator-like 1 isoform X1 n=1 Tax=Amphibalanus amphitrite TaxID=1232801 RepID=UPI001C92B5BF|nr:ral guanine nucleotide dissociation stimulator-like 1 isoform X1 [Amphibalanus amphitrite]
MSGSLWGTWGRSRWGGLRRSGRRGSTGTLPPRRGSDGADGTDGPTRARSVWYVSAPTEGDGSGADGTADSGVWLNERHDPCEKRGMSRWYVYQSPQQSWRLWGDEKSDDAVCSVYLKKVRYHHPGRTPGDSDSDDEISHLEWETVRVRLIKAGTLERLVASLGSHSGELDATYITIFLATYRSFTSARAVVDLIIERYRKLHEGETNEENRDEHKKSLRLAIMVWLDSYPADFQDHPEYPLMQRILEFCRTYRPETSELENKVTHKLEKFEKEEEIKASPMLQRILSTEEVRCLSPVQSDVPPLTFHEISERRFAEQLTRMDADLFRKVIPHQCLGSIWSKRKGVDASSVAATVDQFNAVSFCVISTMLMDTTLRHSQRAKLLAKWVDIAQELRMLKNFSSLKAIISGLQSNPVYRLKQTWLALPRDKSELFDELARIFSDANNMFNQRELLMKEGTAKHAEAFGENDKHLQKHLSRSGSNHTVNHGTIPYLGTFLTDLMYIHAGIPDYTADGLINFDKRRKEFEILAQIKLLQGASNAYNIARDRPFERWFDAVLVLDDKEAYELSYQIEPHGSTSSHGSSSGSSRDKIMRKKVALGHKKHDSLASTSSSSSSQFFGEMDSVSSPNESSASFERHASVMSTSSSSSSVPSLDASVTSSATNQSQQSARKTPDSALQQKPDAGSPYITPDFYIIRVTIRTSAHETEGINLYKSIMLSNSERTPQVIRNAMIKHDVEGNTDDYVLAQLLPDGEKVVPANCNVYYAINTAHDLNFVLRPKKDAASSDTHRLKESKSKRKLLMLHK